MIRLQDKNYYKEMSILVENKYKDAYDYKLVESELLNLIKGSKYEY